MFLHKNAFVLSAVFVWNFASNELNIKAILNLNFSLAISAKPHNPCFYLLKILEMCNTLTRLIIYNLSLYLIQNGWIIHKYQSCCELDSLGLSIYHSRIKLQSVVNENENRLGILRVFADSQHSCWRQSQRGPLTEFRKYERWLIFYLCNICCC